MRNRISSTVAGRIFQSERAKPGILANLVPLGYSPAQGAAFGTQINDAIASRDAHASAKMVLDSARTAYELAIKTTRADVMTARDLLKPILGREHSAAWIAAGFANRLAVNQKNADILGNVQGLKAYFTAHPGLHQAIERNE